MTRRRSAVVLALVCVLAVSLAAATLPAPTDPTGDGTGSGDGAPRAGPGAHDTEERSSGVLRNIEDPSGDSTSPLAGVCVRFLQTPAFFALVALLAGVAAAVLRRRIATTPAVVVVGAVVLSAAPVWFVATDCRSSVSPERRAVEKLVFAPGEPGSSGGGESAAQSATTLLTDPFVLLGVAVVVVSLVGVAYYASGSDHAPPATGADDDDAGDPVDSGANADLSVAAAAAGEAADRIEGGADADNEVYRAWREMAAGTALPNPDAATPREFAAAARESGMPEADVAALTSVFRTVRYGDADPTADRERRAVDALRGIQAAADTRE